jgi:hypothetical protein
LRGISRPYQQCHKFIDEVEHKLCSDCNEWFPLTKEYYYKNKSALDGFNPYCKECTKKRSWKWQKENWDKMLIHFKKMNAKPENKEKHRQLYWERKESGYYEQHYEENKENFKGYNRNRKSKNHNITKSEWLNCKIYFNSECAYCGMPLEIHKRLHNQDLHREHVDPNGADDLSNCIPSCRICNVRKKLIPLNDWYNEQNQNYTEDRLYKIYKWLFEDYNLYSEGGNT